MEYKKLSEGELYILTAIWETGEESVSRSMIEDRIAEKNWNVNTVNTFLARLTEKGAVSCRKIGKTNFYTPIYNKDGYLAFEGSSFLARLYNNSIGSFMAALSSTHSLKKKDIEELEEFLNKLKEE